MQALSTGGGGGSPERQRVRAAERLARGPDARARPCRQGRTKLYLQLQVTDLVVMHAGSCSPRAIHTHHVSHPLHAPVVA